jgi:hypothetical protein
MEHDRTLLASHLKPHLKYIPNYLMPGAANIETGTEGGSKQVAAPPRNLKRKRTSGKVCDSSPLRGRARGHSDF